MKVMISIIGEQPIPNLLALRYERPTESVLIFTDFTRSTAERLHNLITKDSQCYLLQTDPYDIQSIYKDLREVIERYSWHGEDLVFNLTGGTKPMVLAAYRVAAELQSSFLYLQSEGRRSRLYRYEFDAGTYRKVSDEFLPELITIDEFVQAYLGRIPQRRKKQRDEFGKAFEDAIAAALRDINLEVKVGVHLAGALEVDLMVRYENQVGVIQAKTGKSAGEKRGLDQLNAVCDQRYLGTYTRKILAINTTWDKTRTNLKELADAWKITVIELPSFSQDSLSLSPTDKRYLQETVYYVLGGRRASAVP